MTASLRYWRAIHEHIIYIIFKKVNKVFVLLKLDIHVRNKDLHPPVAGICAERATWQW